tara:strand:+ start:283 stop:627 length:345 start_codon:yes stop_codon:yes gene_type:complete
MSSPFQRQFSAKSPLNQDTIKTNTYDVNKEMERRAAYRKEKGFDKSVMTSRGKPLISTKPWRLLTSNKFNQPYGAGRIMNNVVELGKNIFVPGYFPKKVQRAYDYYKHTQKLPY